MTKRKLLPVSLILMVIVMVNLTVTCLAEKPRHPPKNFYYEEGAILDYKDATGDDKGPGYYQYPLDSRLRRGTFDLKRISIYDEGNVYVFKLQMREYIMTEFPDTRRSEEQGFVALAVDIYIDLDGRPGLGFNKALPGREILFADRMGWEKVVMITPLSQFRAYDILKHKTDDLAFQNMVPDVILPDYVQVQRDTLIVRISKDLIGPITDRSGFQCFVMGFSHVVSPNRLLNKDVRGFPTKDDFGGGWDTHGDPPIMDLIVPEGKSQYELLRDYRSEPFRENIEYARIPFVYPRLDSGRTPGIPDRGEPLPEAPLSKGLTGRKPPVRVVTATPVLAGPVGSPGSKGPEGTAALSFDAGFVPLKKPLKNPVKKSTAPRINGFVPLPRKLAPAQSTSGFLTEEEAFEAESDGDLDFLENDGEGREVGLNRKAPEVFVPMPSIQPAKRPK